jgi:hypothetical protein
MRVNLSCLQASLYVLKMESHEEVLHNVAFIIQDLTAVIMSLLLSGTKYHVIV